ncbi:MAG: ShlB/FhaC/HecB family hemolysin secretion/activation protein [Nodosilinea sp.]
MISLLTNHPLSAQVVTPPLPISRDNPSGINRRPIGPLTPKPPSTQPLPESAPPTPLTPPGQLLPSTPSVPTPPQPPSEELPDTITVERFEVIGSTVFSPEDFAKITQPYTQKPISIAELFQVRSKITELYLKKGYLTSGAYIPPQTLQTGVVKIQVVEGGLEAIQIIGTRRLRPSYIRSRLELATRKPLNRDRLLEALQLLQLNPLIQSISADLSAGSRPGESLLQVRVTEAPTFDVQFALDNSGAPSVGTNQRQIQLSEANLLGLGDRLSANYANTNGSNTLDLSYTLPINPRNGTLSFNAGLAFSRVIQEPFDILDIESQSRYLELELRQPILQTPEREFALGIIGTQRQSRTTLFNGEIPFPGRGADPEGRTQITALRFLQEATWRNRQEVVALRSQLGVGLNALSSTINLEPPDSRFLAWQLQAQWVRLLAPETLMVMRGALQLSDRALLPVEQFALGGLDSVRGYPQDLLLTDNGVFASAEVRVPILRISQINGLLQLTPFIDFGRGWNVSGRFNPAPQTLVGTGLGLRFQLSDRLTARLDWGIPLVPFNLEKDNLQERGLYFSIVAYPF